MHKLLQDLRYAVRTLLKKPGLMSDKLQLVALH
jgi:hypothetical protein